ncbi:MAG: YbaB/EbfC family nucleoid-associated protein [Clostridiales bacterium]|nr:YbaB/EbfC family nucleoid-associated protein [Clostridiales bacterium]
MAKGNYPPNFGGGMGNMQQLMQRAQKMQQDAMRKEEEMEARSFEAAAGGGMVKAVFQGTKTLTALEVQPDCIDPDDPEMLQDLIIAAVNAALTLAHETKTAEMDKITGGMKLGL